MERQTKAMSNPYLIQCFKAFSYKWLDFGNLWRFLSAVSLGGQIFNKALHLKDNQRLMPTSEKVVANYNVKIKNSVFALIIPDEPELDYII